MNRRDFIRCAAIVSSGAVTAPETWSMTAVQNDFVHQHKDFLEHHKASLFNGAQRQSVAAVARQIIPTTDTPGADEAKVGLFIELMVEYWFTLAERVAFLTQLERMMKATSTDFHLLDHSAQLRLLQSMEDQASSADWFNLGNTMRTWDSDAPFICQIKELCVLGFMLSEVGSTEFLKPNPMGGFNGEVSISNADSAHATQIPIRVLSKAVQ